MGGVALTLGALGYVLYQVASSDWSQLLGRGVLPLVAGGAVASMMYGAAGFLLALAFWRLLVSAPGPPLRAARIFAIYATTQIYKYLPSNVLHLLGRHAMLKSIGSSHAALLSTAVLEIAGVLIAAGAIATTTGWPMIANLDLIEAWAHLLPLVLALAGVAVGASVVLAIVRVGAVGHHLARRAGAMAYAVAIYGVFFLVSGVIMLVLARYSLALEDIDLRILLAVTSAAWVLGFVVPGAPGGLGVREATMIVLLEPGIGTTNAVALATLYRVATTAGDGLFALAGLILYRIGARSAPRTRA